MSTKSILEKLPDLLKGPYGPIILVLAGIYGISNLPAEHLEKLCKLWPYLNTPFGWLCVVLIIVIYLTINILTPLGKHARIIFESYLAKEKEHVQVLSEVKEGLADLKEIFIQITYQMKEDRSQMQTVLNSIEMMLSEHVVKFDEFKQDIDYRQARTDTFRTPRDK